jgi:predicted metalloendopeptidase
MMLQFWCGSKRPTAAMQQIITDEHSPERFRVIGVLSNSVEFARAYKCAAGTAMNPIKTNVTKCDVW